jgi:hypothetical protein
MAGLRARLFCLQQRFPGMFKVRLHNFFPGNSRQPDLVARIVF